MERWTITELFVLAWAIVAWFGILYWLVFEGIPVFLSM